MPYKDASKRKEYYERNKERILKAQQEKFAADPSIRERIRLASREWMSNNPEQRMLKQARDSSKQRNLEFNITLEDIIIPTHCPYLGVELTTLMGVGRDNNRVSLDRIDNSKGYVKGNVQVISSKANFMKRDATIEELLTFARGILNTHLECSFLS